MHTMARDLIQLTQKVTSLEKYKVESMRLMHYMLESYLSDQATTVTRLDGIDSKLSEMNADMQREANFMDGEIERLDEELVTSKRSIQYLMARCL
jgi:hypothetical protein